MKSTIRDAYNALTFRNCAVFAGLIIFSATSMYFAGFLVWKKFVPPALILFTAFIWWKVARIVAQDGLSRVVNAASVGHAAFGFAWIIAATLDATFFPVTSPLAFTVFILMLSWIAFHSSRVLSIFRRMTPTQRNLVTQSTAVIAAQMTYRKERATAVIEKSEEQLRKLKLVA